MKQKQKIKVKKQAKQNKAKQLVSKNLNNKKTNKLNKIQKN